MKTNIIHTGNCIEVIKSEILKNSIDMIFADPPYNLSGNGLKWKGNQTGGDWHMINENWDKMSEPEYTEFTSNWLNACYNILKGNGAIYVACSYHNIGEIIITLKKLNFKVNNIITWYKRNTMPNMTKRVFTHSTEFVIWAVKGNGWTFNYKELKEMNPEKQKNGQSKQMRDIWDLPLVQGKERIRNENGKASHPTQKPEEMLKRAILASTNEGDIVLDPFLGSGTTACVAQKLKRNWIGIEQKKEYIEIALQRMNTLKGEI